MYLVVSRALTPTGVTFPSTFNFYWMIRMNSHTRFFGSILLLTMLGCASSGSTGGRDADAEATRYEGNTTVQVDNPSITLADYLRRVPGIQVQGNGPGAQVLIRGTETLIGSNDPLFVINGVKVGRDFARVSSLVSMADVQSIEVLKGIDASAYYGIEGGNGVIIIHTK